MVKFNRKLKVKYAKKIINVSKINKKLFTKVLLFKPNSFEIMQASNE